MSRFLTSSTVLSILLVISVSVSAVEESKIASVIDTGCTYEVLGSSPFAAPEQKGTNFVTDISSSLDLGCTFRDSGPRQIQVKINRYVGNVNGAGILTDANLLKSNHVISEKAKIRLPAWDIDYDAAITYPERDRITFNGHDLGYLTGENQAWKLNEFEVPIEWVKFPNRGADGSYPADAINEIRIDIDVANAPAGNFYWCMDVDWVEISFEAIAPILLVHGTNAQSDSWDGNFRSTLEDKKIPYSSAINMQDGGNGTFLQNAQTLLSRVSAIARSFGSPQVHLVAHSKGGLDSRRMLTLYRSAVDPDVLSLFTLSTPHDGTIISDLSSARRNLSDPSTSDQEVEDFWQRDALAVLIGQGPRDPALSEQTVANMSVFNLNFPFVARTRFYNFAANADANGDQRISAQENENGPFDFFALGLSTANLVHHLLGTVSRVEIEEKSTLWGLVKWQEVRPIRTTTFIPNDLVVTEPSARHRAAIQLGTIPANHSTIKSTEVANLVLTRLQSDFPVH